MLILVRHGQSQANEAGLLAGRIDSALTNKGVSQAQALVPELTQARYVITSPLQRARDTAAHAMPHLEALVDDAFIEMNYGDVDGRPLAEVGRSTWEALQKDHDWQIPGGESMADVDQRVHAGLDTLVSEHRELISSLDEHLVIVSHVSPIKSALAWALGVPGTIAWRTRLDNATMTGIGLTGSRLTLHFYNRPAR